MRIRIQANPTNDYGAENNIVDIMSQGIDDFSQWCANVQENFTTAFEAFKESM